MDAANSLATIVTADLLSGVLDQIVALLPVCIPTMVGFIGLRKAIAFVRGILEGA